MSTRIYDVNRVLVAVNGIVPEEYAPDSAVEITYDSNQFEDVVGVVGDVARSKTNDLRATVTIRLMQTSPTNDLFSALANADLLADSGAGVGALLITDANGTSLYQAANCWIRKIPDSVFGGSAGERTWEIRCAKLISHVGGTL